MRVDTRSRHRNAKRIAEKSALSFLQWIRGRSCVFRPYGECGGKIVPMHLDFAGGKGTSTKVADCYVVPSCWKHHQLQHDKGWDTFCSRMTVTKKQLLDAAAWFWRQWPGRANWERKLRAAKGED